MTQMTMPLDKETEVDTAARYHSYRYRNGKSAPAEPEMKAVISYKNDSGSGCIKVLIVSNGAR